MKVEAGYLVRYAAERFNERTAVSWSGGECSFAQVNESANRVGSGFRAMGLEKGDRVGVLAYNTPEVVQLWFGFEKHNLVRMVLHSHFDMDAHSFSLNQVDAKAIVFDTRFADKVDAARKNLHTTKHFVAIGPNPPPWAVPFDEVAENGSGDEPLLDVSEDAPCFLQLTSGTTGQPKAWIKTYRSWQAVINHNIQHLDTFGPTIPPIGPEDVNVHFHALQWASGFQTLYPYFVRGARSVLVDDVEFDPEVLIDTFTNEGATGTFMPGPMLTPVLDAVEARGQYDHSLLRMVVFFGAKELLERTTKLLGPIWTHGFGSTEQGAVTTRLLATEVEGHPKRLDSVGRPGSPFLEVAIMDDSGNRLPPGEVGEIAKRSAMSMGEYWGLPEKSRDAFFPNDWFRPYDVGYIDSDGFLYYADRAGDRIITEGGVVYPHLVETGIMRHRSVANCGVVGLGGEETQEVVGAVLLKHGVEPSDDLNAEIITEANHGLANHEQLSRIVFVEELPTVLGGAKVQRAALRDQLSAEQ